MGIGRGELPTMACDLAVALVATAAIALLSPALMLFALFYQEDPEDSYKHQNW